MSTSTFHVAAAVAGWIATRCQQPDALVRLEAAALGGELADPFLSSAAWTRLRAAVQRIWHEQDHVILRGLPAAGDGASVLLTALCLGSRFRCYRHDQIVKHFQMSPWTSALSHTTRAGHFHTDLNTRAHPPRITAIQCRHPDPAAPRAGVNRVVRAAALLEELRRRGDQRAVYYLTEQDVAMVSDTEPGEWRGRVISDNTIRFHPETIRAAWKRSGQAPEDGEAVLARVHAAAMAVSEPIHLASGDILFVSNHRALHYRGECTVSFVDFPRRFDSREVYVLHLMDEPGAQG